MVKKRLTIVLIIRRYIFIIVVPLGFEPRQTEPESVVLPLHNGTIALTAQNYKKNPIFKLKAIAF